MAHKLLLADDSVTIQRVIELTFADEDVQVVAVGDGKQAIERVPVERPDIVLADVGMPERDGYEVAAFIKGSPQFAHIPVLLLTGAFEPIDETRAKSAGCDGVLVKPFEPQMVINRVKELLAGRRPGGLWGAASASPQGAPPEVPAARPAAPPAPSPGSGLDGLDAYFDRLDAAFSSRGAPATPDPPPAQPARPLTAAGLPADPVKHRDPGPAPMQVPVSAAPGGPSRAAAPVPPPAAPPVSLSEAFAALLAAEQAVPIAPSAAGPAAAVPAPVQITDTIVDDIVRRVIERMGDETVRRSVVETAERVVREEIERIKKLGS